MWENFAGQFRKKEVNHRFGNLTVLSKNSIFSIYSFSGFFSAANLTQHFAVLGIAQIVFYISPEQFGLQVSALYHWIENWKLDSIMRTCTRTFLVQTTNFTYQTFDPILGQTFMFFLQLFPFSHLVEIGQFCKTRQKFNVFKTSIGAKKLCFVENPSESKWAFNHVKRSQR